ncbi:hypothetical protein A1359_07295 [Methylomonas lenta]|uniref:MobA/MobL protein domain-containing protein n=1 Tax=Methylomonas lenta TaxID=980561 RepID=A0A177NGX8_9GAMM|nr:MobQ family relaxase [Methylomonas lenta]OAI16449.1 hypothetical protein A1359_07295 [Methylomonas lenta]
MANFHFQMNHLNRAMTLGIVAAAAYRAGVCLRDNKTGLYYDYRNRSGILHRDIKAPHSAPEWVFDRYQLWNTTDLLETRKDARLARDLLICLPKELSDLHRLELVNNFVDKCFVSQGMIADFAIHGPSEKKGGCNYHVHILLTLRSIDHNGFGLKVREWNKIYHLRRWRREWAEQANHILEREGFDCRIDHRSRAEKEREAEKALSDSKSVPEPHLNADLGDDTLEAANPNESVSFNRSEEATVADRDQLPAELLSNDAEYAEILRAGESLDRMLQNQAGLNFLLGLARNSHLSLSERKAELDDFTEIFNSRLSKINYVIGLLGETSAKERFILQEQLESTSFRAYSNKILATLLEEEFAEKASKEIRTLFRQSQIEEHTYKQYSNEWHSRAVRDGRYFVFNPTALDKIERLRAVENKKWFELQCKAKELQWTAAELEKETQRLQEQLNKNLALSFELKKDFERDRHRDR